MKTVVVGFCPVKYTDYRRISAQSTAMEVMSNSPNWLYPLAFGFKHDKFNEDSNGIYALNVLTRNSRIEIGNNRDLPYIKEILNLCARIHCSVFGYVNSDILLGEEFFKSIQQEADAYIFSRSDTAEISSDKFLQGGRKIIYGGDRHIGADGFFFKKSWWIKNKHVFPDDLVIGETEWDTCYKYLIKRYAESYIEKRVLFHVYHDAKWTLNSPGAKNNIKIWEELNG